jgi:hypothetical protein
LNPESKVWTTVGIYLLVGGERAVREQSAPMAKAQSEKRVFDPVGLRKKNP